MTTITFEESDGRTRIDLRWEVTPSATDEERETFNGAHDGMRAGWGGTLDQFESYLVRLEEKA